MKDIRYLPSGENAITMEFGKTISKDINKKIRQTLQVLKDKKVDGIIDFLPTYVSILINYDSLKLSFDELVKILEESVPTDDNSTDEKVRLIEIPTIYGKEYGPDLEFVSKNASLSEDEVIKIHTGTDYLVYMMGFSPGFTYLGGMDERIATPRLKTPRLKIPAGSVGIAANQTGMYPSDSPGGWQLIGRTPVKLFDPNKTPSVFINAGDYIRYVQIDETKFNEIKNLVDKDEYEVSIKLVDRGELHE